MRFTLSISLTGKKAHIVQAGGHQNLTAALNYKAIGGCRAPRNGWIDLCKSFEKGAQLPEIPGYSLCTKCAKIYAEITAEQEK